MNIKKQIKQLLSKADFWDIIYNLNSRKDLVASAQSLKENPSIDSVITYIETRAAIMTQRIMLPTKDDDFNKGRVFELLDIRKDLLNVIKAEKK